MWDPLEVQVTHLLSMYRILGPGNICFLVGSSVSGRSQKTRFVDSVGLFVESLLRNPSSNYSIRLPNLHLMFCWGSLHLFLDGASHRTYVFKDNQISIIVVEIDSCLLDRAQFGPQSIQTYNVKKKSPSTNGAGLTVR